MNVIIRNKDIKELIYKENGLIQFQIRTNRKAKAVYNCYDKNGYIISDALYEENKSNYIYAIWELQSKYCVVKLK